MTHKEIQRKTTSDKAVGKRRDQPGGATKVGPQQKEDNEKSSANAPIELSTNQTNWMVLIRYGAGQTKHNKKESTTRLSPNWTNKGSALPSKRQTKEDKKGAIELSVKQSWAPIKSKRKRKG